MIHNLLLSEAFEDQRPSKTRLKLYTVGDLVQLELKGVPIQVKVLFRRGEDAVGIVSEQPLSDTGLSAGDLIAFENVNIYSITIDETRHRLWPFMLLTHGDTEDKYILHTRSPFMIAEVVAGDKIEAKPAVWIDEPVDYDKEVPALLKKITDWYFYSYVKK